MSGTALETNNAFYIPFFKVQSNGQCQTKMEQVLEKGQKVMMILLKRSHSPPTPEVTIPLPPIL